MEEVFNAAAKGHERPNCRNRAFTAFARTRGLTDQAAQDALQRASCHVGDEALICAGLPSPSWHCSAKHLKRAVSALLSTAWTFRRCSATPAAWGLRASSRSGRRAARGRAVRRGARFKTPAYERR